MGNINRIQIEGLVESLTLSKSISIYFSLKFTQTRVNAVRTTGYFQE